MGGSTYTNSAYTARVTTRGVTGMSTFQYNDEIKRGERKAGVHPTLSPQGVKIRESRDSVEHPLSLPIGILLDTTGSMAEVPKIIQSKLPKLMGILANEDGKKSYIGKYYPAILMGAVDDYYAMLTRVRNGEGALQTGQFESGLEIDDNLTNLWLTQNGGGSGEESYDLGLYFFARHTVTDHWEKRNKKGYLFVIGDELPYKATQAISVKDVIGDYLEADISFKDLVKEVQKKYNVYFIIPKMTQNWSAPDLRMVWRKYLPVKNVIDLEDPNKICELIAATVAMDLGEASTEDLKELEDETRKILI